MANGNSRSDVAVAWINQVDAGASCACHCLIDACVVRRWFVADNPLHFVPSDRAAIQKRVVCHSALIQQGGQSAIPYQYVIDLCPVD